MLPVEFGHQCLVVFEHFQRLAVAVAKGGHVRRTDVGIDVHVILHVFAEYGTVVAFFCGEFFYLAFAVAPVNGRVHRVVCRVGGEIEAAVRRVVSIEAFDDELAVDGFLYQAAVQVVEIEVIVSVTLAGQHETVGVKGQIPEYVFIDVLVHVVAQDFLALRGAWIGHVHFQAVLMAVQCEDGEFGRVAGEPDARDVTVGFEGQFHRADHTRLDVERLYADSGVCGAGHRILIFITARIFRILLLGRMAAFVPWEGERIHFAFIVADPCYHRVVGIEVERAACAELLFVHPIGDTVDDFVEFPVFGDLAFAVIEQQFDQEQIIVADETDKIAVR